MKAYVLGFLFSLDKQYVWFLRKTKPEWQKGLLNGAGGKVEECDRSYFEAMNREFMEETGLFITNWNHFCTITDDKEYDVACYCAFSDEVPKTTTDEIISRHEVNNLPTDMVFNCYWLIPMALKCEGSKYVVKECFKIENHDDREEEAEEEDDLSWLHICEQCNEQAWDGRICHACGLKII